MPHQLSHTRLGHYTLLIAASLLLTLPNLGTHSLWDIDEGLNAEAAREMHEAESWVVPTYNWELRSGKPAGLYWFQMTSYKIFGVSEWSARFPSVLAALFTVLLTYELGRRMFDPSIGLLGGLILASCIEFGVLAHAATPDAVLLLFTVLTFFLFWIGSRDGSRAWFVSVGVACGLAVLIKGPVGVVLPGLVILMYLTWNRELSRLWDRRLLWGGAAFMAVALPWYVLVTLETKGAWPRDFFYRHNVHRFLEPMENHRAPFWAHAAGLLIFFAPWSAFLIASLVLGIRRALRPVSEIVPNTFARSDQQPDHRRDAYRLLICWFVVYLVFFSAAATKLPNYVLPLYPAMAILTGRFMVGWMRAEVQVPRGVMSLGWLGLIVAGVVTVLGLIIAAEPHKLGLHKAPSLAGLETWTWIGIVPMVAGVFGLLAWMRGRREIALAGLTTLSVVWVALIAAFPTITLDQHKAPKTLVADANLNQPNEDIRIGSLNWFQPSLVFYTQRQVEKFDTTEQAAYFLSQPRRAYLLVPRPIWEGVKDQLPTTGETLAVAYDFYKNTEVVVVTNGVD